ncbi:hypothetical protein MMC21_003792 [Puttea exsequens]|nr:hypothetical protein [Puttea exsequens]
MSGITTSSAGPLATRTPTPREKQLIKSILLLYQLRPSEQAYAYYAPTAIFHDPVSIAEGLDSIKSQFNGMPKIFASSETEKCDLLASSTADQIVLNLTQRYVFKSVLPGRKEGGEKTVNSRVTLKLDGEGMVVRHEEEWDHEGNRTGEEGFVGKLMEGRKKVDAKLVQKLVPSDPGEI